MHSSAIFLSMLKDGAAPWRADWAWGIPLIVLTVVFHVFGLGLIRKYGLLLYGEFTRRRRHMTAFTVVMGVITLLATCLHAIETGVWAFAYCRIHALPDFKSAMLYSLGAMTTFGHENLFLEAHWQLLGEIEALNGWLLFGLTTAFLFGMFHEVSPADPELH